MHNTLFLLFQMDNNTNIALLGQVKRVLGVQLSTDFCSQMDVSTEKSTMEMVGIPIL